MFNNETIQSVWEKGQTVEGYDSHIIRRDPCGAWIMRNEYGNIDSKFGWVIDHVYPESLGGDDSMINLRPMQWENNNAKSDDYPSYRVVIQAEGNENVYIETQYTVSESLRSRLSKLYNIPM